MEAALRPHRGGIVLGLGILSLATFLVAVVVDAPSAEFGGYTLVLTTLTVPVGLTAFVLGWRQLAGVRAARIDPWGRGRSWIGMSLSGVAIVLSALSLVLIISTGPPVEVALMSDGSTVVTEFYRAELPMARYRQVINADGILVNDGSFLRWTRDGHKLEEGSYRDGEREGLWTFWNEDGTIDVERTGFYENDVLVETAAPSPLGDYPVDELGEDR